MLGEVPKRPQGPRLTRFWLLVVVQLWTGFVLMVAHRLGTDNITEAVRLEEGIGTDTGEIGLVLFGGGVVLVVAYLIGGRTLRVVHALFAGFFILLATLSAGAVLSGNPLVGIAAAYQGLVAWCHYRAGIDQPTLTSKGGSL